VSASTEGLLDLGSRAAFETALIASDGAVWLPVSPSNWNLAARIWWWFSPADRRSMVVLYTPGGVAVKVPAIRIAKKSVLIRGSLKS
jgi:hypothetical protein